MKDKLKPCPFCGREATILQVYKLYDTEGIKHSITDYIILCDNNPNCLIQPKTLEFSEQDDAIEAWNIRAK